MGEIVAGAELLGIAALLWWVRVLREDEAISRAKEKIARLQMERTVERMERLRVQRDQARAEVAPLSTKVGVLQAQLASRIAEWSGQQARVEPAAPEGEKTRKARSAAEVRRLMEQAGYEEKEEVVYG